MAYNFKDFKEKIVELEEWLRREFSVVRTGRASPAILDGVLVDSYGSKMRIKELASISVDDPKSIRIVPWDMGQTKNIEKAISDSDLGLSLVVDDKGLRVIFPELTSERRSSLVKVLKQKHEEARITLRLERERVWEDIQRGEKERKIAEDDKFRLKSEMQKIVDDVNKKLDEMVERKEKEIMS